MRLFTISILVLLLLFNCSSEVDVKPVELKPFESLFTLERTLFGENDTNPDEFLLAQPVDIDIAPNGDILLVDEIKIKVFSPDGKGKEIFSGAGYGPGEFPVSRLTDNVRISVSPAGFITGFVEFSEEFYNLFSPEYSLIDGWRIENKARFAEYCTNQEYSLSSVNIYNITHISETAFLIHARVREDRSDSRRRRKLLLYDSGSKLHVLHDEPDLTNYFGSLTKLFEGIWGNYIVYSHGYYDVEVNDSSHYMIFHLFDINKETKTSVKIPFEPVPNTEAENRFMRGIGDFGDPEFEQRYKENFNKKISELGEDIYEQFIAREFQCPFIDVKIDNGNAFIFLQQTEEEDDVETEDAERFETVVYNLLTGKETVRFYSPMWLTEDVGSSYYSFKAIVHDEKVYRLFATRDEFARVEIYNIDPAVYGK